MTKKINLQISFNEQRDVKDSYSQWRTFVLDETTASAKSTLSIFTPSSATNIKIANGNLFPLATSSRPQIFLLATATSYEYVCAIASTLRTDGTSDYTIQRGYWGSTPQAWPIGTPVYAVNYDIDNSPNYDFEFFDLGFVRKNFAGTQTPPDNLRGFAKISLFFPKTGNQLYIFGGVDSNNIYYNTLYRYDTKQAQWSLVNTYGTPPSPRAWCGLGYAVISGVSYLFVFGGYDGSNSLNTCYRLNLSSLTWGQIRDLPRALNFCQAASYHSNVTKYYSSQAIDVFGTHDDPRNNCYFYTYDPLANTYQTKTLYNTEGVTVFCSHLSVAQILGTPNSLLVGRGGTSSSPDAPFVHVFLRDQERVKACSTPLNTPLCNPAVAYDEHDNLCYVHGGSNTTRSTIYSKIYALSPTTCNMWQYDDWGTSLADYGHAGVCLQETTTSPAYATFMGGTKLNFSKSILQRKKIYSSQKIKTSPFDLLATPDSDVEFNTSYSTEKNSSVLFACYYSHDNNNYYYHGYVVDGDILPPARYYRFIVTVNSDGIDRATIQEIAVSFAQTLSLSHEDIVDCSAIRERCDLQRNSSAVQEVDLEFLIDENFKQQVRSTLLNKSALLRVEDNDAKKILLKGYVNDNEINGNTVKLTISDPFGKFENSIPAEDDDGVITPLRYTASGIATNPIDIMLDILRNQLNIPDRFIDLESFEALRPSYTSINFSRTISQPTDAWQILAELAVDMKVLLLKNRDCKIAVKSFSTASPSRYEFDDTDDVREMKTTTSLQDIRDWVSLWYGWDGEGDRVEDYAKIVVATDADSVEDYGRTPVHRIKSKFIPATLDSYAASVVNNIIDIYKNEVSQISWTSNLDSLDSLEIGDTAMLLVEENTHNSQYIDIDRCDSVDGWSGENISSLSLSDYYVLRGKQSLEIRVDSATTASLQKSLSFALPQHHHALVGCHVAVDRPYEMNSIKLVFATDDDDYFYFEKSSNFARTNFIGGWCADAQRVGAPSWEKIAKVKLLFSMKSVRLYHFYLDTIYALVNNNLTTAPAIVTGWRKVFVTEKETDVLSSKITWSGKVVDVDFDFADNSFDNLVVMKNIDRSFNDIRLSNVDNVYERYGRAVLRYDLQAQPLVTPFVLVTASVSNSNYLRVNYYTSDHDALHRARMLATTPLHHNTWLPLYGCMRFLFVELELFSDFDRSTTPTITQIEVSR